MKKVFFLLVPLLFLAGCAGAVYNYGYGEGERMQYPSSISVGFSPSPVPLGQSSKLKLSVGTDMAYLIVPMGSDIALYNRDFYAGLRLGDQWSTEDNEVLGAGFYIGKNFFLDKKSIMTLGGSYTTLNLTPRKVVEGDLKGARVVFQKILLETKSTDMLLPSMTTVFISNNLYSYNFTGTVEREVGDTIFRTDTLKLNYKGYLLSIGLGFKMQFSSVSWYGEIGKIFPRYLYDENDSNPVRYDAYLSTGVYLNF